MSNSKLPERASLEYLKKLAKERLAELRLQDSQAKLADALFGVARDHGFASWRALKIAVEQQTNDFAASFFLACDRGDAAAVRDLLAYDPGLIKAEDKRASHAGWTALHLASKTGRADLVRVLLQHGADPNRREAGDNTTPLHWAAAERCLNCAKSLLEAGADVHGYGDLHELDSIGWATYFHPAKSCEESWELANLLIERGARHHIFSAITIGDLKLIRSVVEDNPASLDRRMSRYEQGQTALHFATHRKRADIVELLIDLGADIDAKDALGRTPIELAMLRGDTKAASRLRAAGAQEPVQDVKPDVSNLASLSNSVKKLVPMIYASDVARSLDWYCSLGFKELNRYADGTTVNFAMVKLGHAEVMINLSREPASAGASLWFYTDQVDAVYRSLKSRQILAAKTSLAGGAVTAAVHFEQDLEDTFYGARQFGVRDPDGYVLYFIQLAPQ
jgi:ankyrin repeat protein/uncharacterized glyoxalase superfamily protein PhnB